MKSIYKYIYFLACLLIGVACNEHAQTQNQTQNTKTVDSVKTVVDTNIKKEPTFKKCSDCYNVIDVSSNKELDTFWDFTYTENGNFYGFKDYNYHEFYIVSEGFKFNISDTIGRDAWALILGYKIKNEAGEEEKIFKEVFLITDFEKYLELSIYKNQSETGPEEIESCEFLFLDTIPIYEIANKEAVYVKGDMNLSVSYVGYQLTPNRDVADYFLLGKPKYKLIRQK